MDTNYGNPSVHGKMCKAAHCVLFSQSAVRMCFDAFARKSGKAENLNGSSASACFVSVQFNARLTR